MSAKTAFRRIACLAVCATAALAAPLAAEAGPATPEVAVPRVTVPHMPAPGGLAGCWSAGRPIYGPYAFSFCSNGGHGSYQVRGGGLSCGGNVSVVPGRAGSFTVRLGHGRCNGRTDWSADYLVCRSAGGWNGGYGGGWSGGYGVRPEVAVPRAPAPRHPASAARLDCTYYPVVAGYSPIGLAMFRN